MPAPDPALAWLLKNDPDAAGNREAYMRRRGIISAKRAGEIRAHECELTEADLHEVHCPGCEEKYDLHRRSVD